MKYMVTWHERPMGSAAEYERAQKRILSVFQHWTFPDELKVLQFVVRVGEYGGYLLVETTAPSLIHKLTSAYPVFTFRVDLVLDIQDAVNTEVEAIAWRDSLPS